VQPTSPEGDSAFVTIARIIKPHGLRGEMAAELFTDFPGRFTGLDRVFLEREGRRQSFALRGHFFHRGGVVLTLAGIEDRSAADGWRGAEVQVPLSERRPLEEDRYYVSDLTGCELRDGGRRVGEIVDVETGPQTAPLLHVRSDAGGEVLVPFAREYIEAVDLFERRVSMRLPQGLIEGGEDENG
jgi:16S rRNA processing protein RimM